MPKLISACLAAIGVLVFVVSRVGGIDTVIKANDHERYPIIEGEDYVLKARLDPPLRNRICLDLKVSREEGPSSSYRHCGLIERATPMTTSIALECTKPYTTYLFGYVDNDVHQIDMRIGRRAVISVRPVDLRYGNLSMYLVVLPGRTIPRVIYARSSNGESIVEKKVSRWKRPFCIGHGRNGGVVYGTLD